MRTITVEGAEGFTIEAPSVMAYAFNRLPFAVKNESAVYLRCTFLVQLNGVELGAETREAYGGSVSANLQQYVQSAFSEISLSTTATASGRVVIPSQMMKTFAVLVVASATLESGTISTLNYTVGQDVIFGTMGARESSSMPSKIRLYPNLPQTFDLLANEQSKLYLEELGPGGGLVYNADLPVSAIGTASGYRLVNVNMGGLGAGYKLLNVVVRPTMVVNGAEVVAPAMWRTLAEIDDSTCGVYIRWLDRHGRWQYFLFTEAENSYDVKTLQEWEIATTNDPADYVDGLNDAISKMRSFQRSNTRKLTAPLVDEGLRELLLSLMMAIVVDVYDGRDAEGTHLWHRVLVKPGKFSEAYQPLQNFSVEIEEPDVYSQIS